MIAVKVSKGYNLNITGAPSLELETLKRPLHVAVLPDRIAFIKPRLLVKVGDFVKIGTALFEDKRNTDLKFLSPGGGEIVEINYGPRRVIREILIKLDAEEQVEEFRKITGEDFDALDRKELIRILRQSGVWPLIRELPFRDIANPDVRPSSIWVTLGGQDPFQPSPSVYLKGKEDLFAFGLEILKKLVEHVHVTACDFAGKGVENWITHQVSGRYPANDPGVLLYHTKKSSDENLSWYLSGQDLLMISGFLKTGRYVTERIVATGGSLMDKRRHFLTRIGVPVQDLVAEILPGERCIAGGLFTGYALESSSYLGLYETSLIRIPDGDEAELFGFLRPGFKKPSFSRTFLSVFYKKNVDSDSGMHGEERACVNCGTCAKICPVDILPQFTLKCVGADSVEEALSHGLLDCVECGLCTYVCPSKIEICEALKKAKHDYYKEKV
ncbi:MAG: 4Fe-4S dicluster domain-containing protein [Desulfobacterales bacterium]